jgi:hypothetical protein
MLLGEVEDFVVGEPFCALATQMLLNTVIAAANVTRVFIVFALC